MERLTRVTVGSLPATLRGHYSDDTLVSVLFSDTTNIEKRQSIIEYLDIPLSIVHHTWYGRKAHVCTNGRIKRCILRELVVSNDRVVIRAQTSAKMCSVTLMQVLLTHIAWIENVVVSDEEDDVSDEEDEEADTVYDAIVPLQLKEEANVSLLGNNRCVVVRHAIREVSKSMYVVDNIQYMTR